MYLWDQIFNFIGHIPYVLTNFISNWFVWVKSIDLSGSERGTLKWVGLSNLDSLTVLCLNVDFFGFMILGVHLASCFCKFLSFIEFCIALFDII